MWPKTQKKAELELILLHRLMDVYQDLRRKVSSATPDMIQLAALATFLHSLYTGIENIFKRIAREVDGSVPTGDRSHSDLLVVMTRPSTNRPAVISGDLSSRLLGYLEFRHVFRQAYTFQLDWRKMKDLVFLADDTLDRLEKELRAFFAEEQ